MNYDETASTADKILHVDGSVTTASGELILPPEPNRAKEYENRAAAADKWLCPDGSVVNKSGTVILPPDDARAFDYTTRSAAAALVVSGGGGISDSDDVWLGTRAEYNALPEEERGNPDIVHFIREGS